MSVMTTGRLLVGYSNAATHVSTTMEYLSSIRRHSRYEVSYLHVTDDAVVEVDLNQFDAVLNSYCARLCFPGYVNQAYVEALKGFRGVRLLAVQDEYHRTGAIRQAIREIGFHAVLTCVPPEQHDFVYPKEMFPDTEFVTVLTGYVPRALKAHGLRRIPLGQRPVAIGYRGRENAAYYGRLGFDKYEIGRRMREICLARGIAHDIETSEETRIYGDAWHDFLGQCRTTLGTESGSNVFDFDGSLETKYREMTTKRGGTVGYEDFCQYTDPLENEIQMGQISPRIFEAAAAGTPMILFSGRYSGIVAPDEHYIELKKDFSNIDQVLDRIKHIDTLEQVADRAHRHLIQSGNYDYSRFVEIVDALIDRNREGQARRACGSRRPARPLDQRMVVDPQPVLNEQPTPWPRDAIYHRYKQLYREHEALKREFANETGRLTREVQYLRSEFASETQRLIREVEALQSALASRSLIRLGRAFSH